MHCAYVLDSEDEVAYADTFWIDAAGTSNWTHQEEFGDDVRFVSMDAWRDGDDTLIYVAFIGDPAGAPVEGVYVTHSTDYGRNWSDLSLVAEHDNAYNVSIASQRKEFNGAYNVYVVFHGRDGIADLDTVYFYASDDKGDSWDEEKDWWWADARTPCIAVDDGEIIVSWIRARGEDRDKVYYSYNYSFGDDYQWEPDGSEEHEGEAVDFKIQGPEYRYNTPSVAILQKEYQGVNKKNVLFAAELCWDPESDVESYWVSTTHGMFGTQSGIKYWSPFRDHWLSPTEPDGGGICDVNANPSIASYGDWDDRPSQAVCVWADHDWTTTSPDIYASFSGWDQYHRVLPPIASDGAGSRLRPSPDGGVVYCSREGANIHAGPVMPDGFLVPTLAGAGELSALAVDPDNEMWVAYTKNDTLWCQIYADTIATAIYEGTSATPPGQPSITMYPIKDNGDHVAALTFAVYDSAGGGSRIMFGKVKEGSVLLDTVVNNTTTLTESLPSINVDSDSTFYVVWQHGDAVVEKDMDFHPGCWTAHGDTWSATAVLSADGSHPSSSAEGNILHAVWGEENTSGPTAIRTIKSKSNDFTDSLWSGWQDDGTASESDTLVKTNPVYAGAGVTVWQEEVSSKWRIMGEVRGDTVSLVSTDSGSYHPHAVAESSAISPSINQVRVSLLWTEGVIFEVDSAVYDTGVTQFKVCSLNVSNAGSDATISNNGRKLLRKDGSDSLFAVYADASNSIMYGRSADGSQWTREEVAADGVFPAVCEDGTGTRWIVYWDREPDQSGFIWVRARFDSAGTLSGVRDLYEIADGDSCGSISVAGSYDDATMCAYAAFREIRAEESDRNILVKFGDTDVYSTTLNDLGEFECNPCISTEWVAGEPSGDHIHLVWENTDEDEAYYAMTSDPIAADEWSPNITWENSVNLSDTPEDDSRNPVVANDADRVVVAWAERTTSDILVVQRSTDSLYDNFQDTVNVSVSAVTSAYPTIAMGDSVVVVWEERKSGTDYDIYASVELDTGFSIQDNSGKSTYPFAVFENQASGDTAIPYIHLIWSDTPAASYYEVGYRLYNIKESGTGGQQSGGNIGPLLRPKLSACRPNPFASRTLIRYQFSQTGRVLLRVYDASGRMVRTLQNGVQKPGAYNVDWDGADDRGRTVANGIYFYRLDTPGFRDVKKAVLMK